jgi:aspartokinase/homoserine dehydrogenase 1
MQALRINIVLFGIGNVGSTLINQVIDSQRFFLEKRNIDLRFPIIANSTVALFEKDGIKNDWQANFAQNAGVYEFNDIIEYSQTQKLENLIAVDVTDSLDLVKRYVPLIQNGFDIVASNKNANVLHSSFYKELRRNLKKFNKTFLYETNVGSGFPVLQTIKDLHYSGENITKIRGVFSDSLSYIFNRFSYEESTFSAILSDAENLGITKLNSREDLSGIDVAKKILILAREINDNYELCDVEIETLLLPNLNEFSTKKEYATNKELLDQPFKIAKIVQSDNHVLRYIGEYDILENKLETKLVSEPTDSPLGQLKGMETIFEIYTQSYGKIPIVIHGAGSGNQVTARGVLTDLLKVASKKKIREFVLV